MADLHLADLLISYEMADLPFNWLAKQSQLVNYVCISVCVSDSERTVSTQWAMADLLFTWTTWQMWLVNYVCAPIEWQWAQWATVSAQWAMADLRSNWYETKPIGQHWLCGMCGTVSDSEHTHAERLWAHGWPSLFGWPSSRLTKQANRLVVCLCPSDSERAICVWQWVWVCVSQNQRFYYCTNR